MPRPRIKRAPSIVAEESSSSTRDPDGVRAILWGIAEDSKQSGTARVSACRLLLIDARERDGGETRRNDDLNKRALALMRQVAH